MFLQLDPVSCQTSSQLYTQFKVTFQQQQQQQQQQIPLKAIYSLYLSRTLSEKHIIYINTSPFFSGKKANS